LGVIGAIGLFGELVLHLLERVGSGGLRLLRLAELVFPDLPRRPLHLLRQGAGLLRTGLLGRRFRLIGRLILLPSRLRLVLASLRLRAGLLVLPARPALRLRG